MSETSEQTRDSSTTPSGQPTDEPALDVEGRAGETDEAEVHEAEAHEAEANGRSTQPASEAPQSAPREDVPDGEPDDELSAARVVPAEAPADDAPADEPAAEEAPAGEPAADEGPADEDTTAPAATTAPADAATPPVIEAETAPRDDSSSEDGPAIAAGREPEPRGATAAGAAPTGAASLAAALRPRVTRGQIAAAVLLGLLGFAVAVQVRATQDAGLSGLRQSDLIRVLDDVGERSARLQVEARELERTRDRLTSSSGGRRAALEESRRRAETLGIFAGTLPAEGPGIELTIPDPRGEVGPEVLLDTVQELRDAGAEAMQIGTVRVVASTSFIEAEGGGVRVDGTVLRAPYRVVAIGDQRALATALAIPGGVIEVLAGKGSTAVVAERSEVTVDALATPAPPRHARPVPEPTGPAPRSP